MSFCGLGLLYALSLPPWRNPPPRPWGPGDWDGLGSAIAYEREKKLPLYLVRGAASAIVRDRAFDRTAQATFAGCCVSISNFILSAALPLAGLTRAPVWVTNQSAGRSGAAIFEC